MPDARSVPSIAQQLRAARRRRECARRIALGALLAVPVALFGAQVVTGSSADTGTASPSSTTSSVPTGLDPDLVDAFERAQAGAARAGHELTITSGFRTAE